MTSANMATGRASFLKRRVNLGTGLDGITAVAPL